MHIAIGRFPAVPAEHDQDFRDWFDWSNDQLRGMVGLRGRRLLRAPDGCYTALVENDSEVAFVAMLQAEAVTMIHRGLGPILNDRRQAMSYDVLVDFPTACRCDGNGTCSCEGAEEEPGLQLVSGGAPPAAPSGAGIEVGGIRGAALSHVPSVSDPQAAALASEQAGSGKCFLQRRL